MTKKLNRVIAKVLLLLVINLVTGVLVAGAFFRPNNLLAQSAGPVVASEEWRIIACMYYTTNSSNSSISGNVSVGPSAYEVHYFDANGQLLLKGVWRASGWFDSYGADQSNDQNWRPSSAFYNSLESTWDEAGTDGCKHLKTLRGQINTVGYVGSPWNGYYSAGLYGVVASHQIGQFVTSYALSSRPKGWKVTYTAP